MKIEVYIWVLCACLVTLEAHNKRSASDGSDPNAFTFLSIISNTTMTNHTLNTTKGSILESIILPKRSEITDK
ncbi:hypothetical protein R3I93_000472 [Phoxinus phoxinus]|uniref:Uncharacterized protein n=1 Tax=Phoxinus phoxinus TaxID=58324 RepID=A0AAN9HKS3_9TELE